MWWRVGGDRFRLLTRDGALLANTTIFIPVGETPTSEVNKTGRFFLPVLFYTIPVILTYK